MFPFVSLQTRSQAFSISFPQGFLKVENKSLSIKGAPVFCKHLSYLQRGCRGSQAEEEKRKRGEPRGWEGDKGCWVPKLREIHIQLLTPPEWEDQTPGSNAHVFPTTPMPSMAQPANPRGHAAGTKSSLPVTDGPSPGSRGPKIPGLWHNTKGHRSCQLDLSWFKEN